MSATTLIEFDDQTEHAFDAVKMELANDKGLLKSLVLASEILFSNFDKDGELTSKRGSKTLVLSGTDDTGEVLGGVLNFPNNDQSIATYPNITDIVDDFAFRCRCETTLLTLVVDRDFLILESNVDQSRIRFYMQNQGSGVTRIKREIRDGAGAITNELILGLRNFSTDPNFNVAFSNDDNGDTLTYLDGVLISTIASPVFDFTDCNIVFSNNVQAVSDFDNFELFKSDAITAAFTFPFPESTTFDLLENTMITVIPFLLDEVTAFSIIEQIPDDTQLKHFLILNLDQIYHDGTAWVESDGTLDQSNTDAEILANIATLPLVKGIGAILQVGHVFKSDLGYVTADIESLTIVYEFQFKPDEVRTCLVFGTVVDNANQVVVGATIRVKSDDAFVNGAFKGPHAKTTTNAQGKFSISIPETATDGTTVDINIEYTQKDIKDGVEFDDPVTFEIKGIVVPNLPTAKLSDLVIP